MVLKKCDGSSTSKITHKVIIDAEYNSDLEYFDFDSDMDPWTISRAMSKVNWFELIQYLVHCTSKEPWSREYFDRLKAAHQCHYEQFGEVSGTFSVDGEEKNLKVLIIYDTLFCIF